MRQRAVTVLGQITCQHGARKSRAEVFWNGKRDILMIDFFTGVGANADPYTNKLRTRITQIWGNRRRQPNRSAMEGPPPGMRQIT